MSITVHEIRRDDLQWEFSSNKVYAHIEGLDRYAGRSEVDPFLAYPHNRAIVETCAELADSRFPIEWPVTINIFPAEDIGRTNGWTRVDSVYDGYVDDQHRYHPAAAIALSAKRIPIHPAMTRYLVAHEYGHVIEEWLNARQAGTKLHDDTLITDYARMRGLEMQPHYGGGRWHVTPGEVFANDFRILFLGVEWEFWPHPGISHPYETPAIARWWDDVHGFPVPFRGGGHG